MEDITKPSITRLARRAGVKSVSDDCFNPIRLLIANHLDELVRAALVVNSEHQTKTLVFCLAHSRFQFCRVSCQNHLKTWNLCRGFDFLNTNVKILPSIRRFPWGLNSAKFLGPVPKSKSFSPRLSNKVALAGMKPYTTQN